MPVDRLPPRLPRHLLARGDGGAGRITKVDAAPGNPLTQGFICQKVKRHAERVYGPDRVLSRSVRTGAKGSGGSARCAWDEALDLVAARFRGAVEQRGPASLVPLLYNSSAGVLASAALTDRLFDRLGRSRGAGDHLCGDGRRRRGTRSSAACCRPTRSTSSMPPMSWCGAPTRPCPTHTSRRSCSRPGRAGARLTVVDPRRTAMAARADRARRAATGHRRRAGAGDGSPPQHPGPARRRVPRPARQRRRRAAGRGRTVDARCRGRASAAWSAGDIAAFAEEYAALGPSFLRVGWGIERNRNGGSSYKAVLALPVLAGHFGVTGSRRDDEPVGRGAALDARAPTRGPGRAPRTPPAEHEPSRPAAVRGARRAGGGRCSSCRAPTPR